MKNFLAIALACIFSGTAFSETPWFGIKKKLEEYQAVAVHESEYSYGGSCIRLMSTDVKDQKASEILASILSNVQEEIPIFELHLQSFTEQHMNSLSFLEAAPELKLLNLGGASFDKKQLAVLKEHKAIESIFLSGDGWNEEAFSALGQIQSFVEMRLQYLKSDNWSTFPEFPNLVEIDLGSSNFDDDGAVVLVKSSKLERIHAYETNLGDQGLLELAKLKELSFLGLTLTGEQDSKLSDKGIEEFKKLRPDVEVSTDRPKTSHPPKPPMQANPIPGVPQQVT